MKKALTAQVGLSQKIELLVAACYARARRIPLVPIWLLLGAAVLLAATVGQSPYPFSPDEAYTVIQARAPSLAELMSINLGNEETPPLYFVLVRLWTQLWADSTENTMRLFSACCLAATIPLVGLLGYRLYGRAVGLWAAILVAASPAALRYGHEARAYTLALLLTVLTILLAYRYIEQSGRLIGLLYVLSASALLYTSYFAVFTLLGLSLIGLVLLHRREQRAPGFGNRALLGWIGAHILVLLIYLPWIPGMVYQHQVLRSLGYGSQDSGVGLSTAVQILTQLALTPARLLIGDHTSAAVLWIDGLGLALVVGLLRGKLNALLLNLSAGVLLPLFGVIAVFFEQLSSFFYRYALLVLPLGVVCLAAVLLRDRRWLPVTHTLLLVVAILGVTYSVRQPPIGESRGGWATMARLVERLAQPDDGLFIASPWEAPAFRVQYHGPDLVHGVETFAQYQDAAAPPWEIDSAALAAFMRPGRRAWVVWDRPSDTIPPPIPANLQYQERRFGSTSLVLVTTPGSDAVLPAELGPVLTMPGQ